MFRIGDKVFAIYYDTPVEGVVMDIYGDEYLVVTHNDSGHYIAGYWIPQKDCTLLSALESWSSEPPTR